MESKLKLNAKLILDKKFSKDVKGYNPEEVDAFLDLVIADYQAFTRLLKEKDAQIEVLDSERKTRDEKDKDMIAHYRALMDKAQALEVENASYKKKLEGIRPGDKVTSENMEWIQRCNKLEEFVYRKGFSKVEVEQFLSGSGDGYFDKK